MQVAFWTLPQACPPFALTQSSRSVVDGQGGLCWPCQCCQSKAKKWPKAGAAGGARRESEAAPCACSEPRGMAWGLAVGAELRALSAEGGGLGG